MVATCLISSFDETFLDLSLRILTTSSTFLFKKLVISDGDPIPVCKACEALKYNSFAKTVDVVLPSPATVAVFSLACFRSFAPRSSTLFSNIILFATVAPSLVKWGGSLFFSIRTSLPLGPIVIDTASQSFLTPLFSSAWASASKKIKSDIVTLSIKSWMLILRVIHFFS